jgi:D-serine deaminase-like pyridoxal phosphate-dependent protein
MKGERLCEEHPVIAAPDTTRFRVGERLAVVPAHGCTTMNLHPAVLMVTADGLRWDPVAAHGRR